MDSYSALDQIVALLQRRGLVTYNALKLHFHLDDEQLVVLQDDLLYAHPHVVEDAGRRLRWSDDTTPAPQTPAPPALQDTSPSVIQTARPLQEIFPCTPLHPPRPNGASLPCCAAT